MMIVNLLQLTSCLMLGLLMGSLLTEAMILVPYWRNMEPKEFLRLHSTLGPQLLAYFAPLTILATVFPILVSAILGILGADSFWLSLIPTSIVLLMLAIYFSYFKGANDSFKSGSVGEIGLPAELARWAKWHWVRVVFGVAAFFVSLLLVAVN